MKKAIAAMTLMTLSSLFGCSQGTPGGTGTTGEQPAYGQADNTFNLSVPLTSSSLQQGEVLKGKIGIQRAKNFDDNVSLKFSDLPKGVTVDPATADIKSGETEANVTFKATDETPLGDFSVKVTGHPTTGSDAHIVYKLTITAKDSFTLDMPKVAPLKQGDTQTVLIVIKRDKTFDQDVSVSFGDMPTGVTLEPSDFVIKQGDSTAEVKLTGAEDASLGDFTVKVTGHPAKGVDAMEEMAFTVVKK